MAIEDPQHCVAIHLTTVLADWEPETLYGKAKMTFDFVFRYLNKKTAVKSVFSDMLMSKEEVKGLDEMEKFYEEELGYMHIHTTKPQSVKSRKKRLLIKLDWICIG